MGLIGVLILLVGGKLLQANPDAFSGAGTWGDWIFAFGVIGAILWVIVWAIALIGLMLR